MEIKLKYKILEKIGSGSFGSVFKAINIINNKSVALKRVKKTEGSFKNEIKISNYLSNIKGIYKLHWYGTDSIYRYVVFDLLEDSLSSYLKKYKTFQLYTVKYLMKQLLEILMAVHNKYILHRDIKLDNLLMDKHSQLHLIDYGLAKIFRENGKHIDNKSNRSLVGTYNYMSINIHNKETSSRRDDLISIGYVMEQIIFGKLIWESMNETNMILEKTRFKSKNIIVNKYLNYCYNLNFDEDPDYLFLTNLIDKLNTKCVLEWNYNDEELSLN